MNQLRRPTANIHQVCNKHEGIWKGNTADVALENIDVSEEGGYGIEKAIMTSTTAPVLCYLC